MSKHRRHFKPKPRSTPSGEHVPVMLNEVLAALAPKPGEIAVDCTLGFAGHAQPLLQHVGATGKLIGFDLDTDNIQKAEEQLSSLGFPYSLHHTNFAAVSSIIPIESPRGCDCLLADLGMSSMQVDDAERGFSYMRDGPLDMRMDRSRGRTAADLLQTLGAEELAAAFREFGDEPEAEKIAQAIVDTRKELPITRTTELRALIEQAAPVVVPKKWVPGQPKPWQLKVRPTARVFQALRILVNRELANLQALLRMLPQILAPGGRVALISFHSGEDRLIKSAFRDGLRAEFYSAISEDPIRASEEERRSNPRSRSAKLRWARRAVAATEARTS